MIICVCYKALCGSNPRGVRQGLLLLLLRCAAAALSLAMVSLSSDTFICSDLTYSTVSSSMSDVLVVFSMLGTRSCSFFMRSLMRVLRTRSAMLRGCVAQPRFARARICT
jgi:hypothetical protein